jgi:hypothetical protein
MMSRVGAALVDRLVVGTCFQLPREAVVILGVIVRGRQRVPRPPPEARDNLFSYLGIHSVRAFER